jgi:hypothetical protein
VVALARLLTLRRKLRRAAVYLAVKALSSFQVGNQTVIKKGP